MHEDDYNDDQDDDGGDHNHYNMKVPMRDSSYHKREDSATSRKKIQSRDLPLETIEYYYTK